MSLVLVLSPTLSAQDPYTELRVWTQCYPQQWSNPDYHYLEPVNRVKPEQPHQMAVSTNHNLGGCVIQLTSHLSDVENYWGFQGYSPFHLTIHPHYPNCWPMLVSLCEKTTKFYCSSILEMTTICTIHPCILLRYADALATYSDGLEL